MRSVWRALVGSVIAAGLSAATGLALAGEKQFGPFTVDDALPQVIVLNGIIDDGSALNFRRALQAAPAAKLVTLNSPGGDVQMGLLIADDIHQRKLATYIPSSGECMSACSFLFLAGHERKADGKLGVHQISSASSDLVGAQLAISDILDVLNRFGTPVEVMHIMFKTPPASMHVFTNDEIARYQLNRSADDLNGAPVTADSSGKAARAAVDLSFAPSKERQVGETSKTPMTSHVFAPDVSPGAALSTLETFAKRPNRVAVYAGLDLYGDDIASNRSEDAVACATRCLEMQGQCKAFTFNANPKIKRGPNCFLKSSAGRADANSVAFSGRFLSAAEPDPLGLTIGAIDPQTALYEDIDIPGGDLTSSPLAGVRAPVDCRHACIDEPGCVAFTFIRATKQCWLKGAIGSPQVSKGLISGVKKLETFRPAKIISLDAPK